MCQKICSKLFNRFDGEGPVDFGYQHVAQSDIARLIKGSPSGIVHLLHNPIDGKSSPLTYLWRVPPKLVPSAGTFSAYSVGLPSTDHLVHKKMDTFATAFFSIFDSFLCPLQEHFLFPLITQDWNLPAFSRTNPVSIAVDFRGKVQNPLKPQNLFF